MKKILAILLALTLALSTMLLVTSCGDNGDEGGNGNGGETGGEGSGEQGGDNTQGGGETDSKVEFKVTVKNQNGEAVAGVGVYVLNSSSVPVSTTPTLTGADGVATFSLEDGSYKAMIIGGSGYTTDGATMKDFSSDRTVSFSVITEEAKETLSYTVKVIDQYGAPVAGVRLQACTESCIPFANATDENGETTQELEVTDAEYKVQLNVIPDGYSEIDNDNDPTTTVKYSFDENRVATVVINKN